MVSGASIAAMIATLVMCVAVPFGGMALLRRHHAGVWRAFWCGMLAFFLSQVATRTPLLMLWAPTLPEPWQGLLLSVPSVSFSAGLFEETGRLLVMLWLLRGFHRLADGVAFGLGHGGLEALLVVGLSQVNNLVLAVTINAGGRPEVTNV